MIANQLAFQLAFQWLRQLSSFCLKSWEVEPSCGCIKEKETDCAQLVVLYVKKNETVRKVEERMRRRRLSIRAE